MYMYVLIKACNLPSSEGKRSFLRSSSHSASEIMSEGILADTSASLDVVLATDNVVLAPGG